MEQYTYGKMVNGAKTILGNESMDVWDNGCMG